MAAEMTRRNVLRFGIAGALVAGVALPEAPRARATGPERTHTPVTEGDLTPVFSPDGTFRLLPSELGFTLPHGTSGLGTTDAVRVTYDAAAYSTGGEAVILASTQPPASLPLAAPVSDASGRSVLVVPVAALPVDAREVRVILGGLTIPDFPDDLVSGLTPVRVELIAEDRVIWAGHLGGERTVGSPWGATLGVCWSAHETSAGARVWCPTLVVLTSVGPDPAPSGTALRILLDARMHPDASVEGAYAIDGSVWPGTNAASTSDRHRELVWTSSAEIKPHDTVQIGLACSDHQVGLTMTESEAPLVDLVPPEKTWQRRTGHESASRDDDILTRASLEAATGV